MSVEEEGVTREWGRGRGKLTLKGGMDEVDGFGVSGASPEFLSGAQPQCDRRVLLGESLNVELRFVENVVEGKGQDFSRRGDDFEHSHILVNVFHPRIDQPRPKRDEGESTSKLLFLSSRSHSHSTQHGRKNAHGQWKSHRSRPARSAPLPLPSRPR